MKSRKRIVGVALFGSTSLLPGLLFKWDLQLCKYLMVQVDLKHVGA